MLELQLLFDRFGDYEKVLKGALAPYSMYLGVYLVLKNGADTQGI